MIKRLLVYATLSAPSFLPVLAEEPKAAPDTKAVQDEIYIPSDLDDAVRVLKDEIPDEVKKRIKAGEVEPISMHMGLGMTLRNRWGLWAGSRLAAYFRASGIGHPDSMSGFIINALFHEIREEKYDLLEMMRDDQKEWPCYHLGIMEGDNLATDRYQAILYSRLDYNEEKRVVSTTLTWNPDDGRIYLVKASAEPRIASAEEIADLKADISHWLFSDDDLRILEELRKLGKEQRLERIKAMGKELGEKLDIFPRAKDPEGIDKVPDLNDPFSDK